jgi:flagellar hook-length control protein FliK
MFKEMLDRSKDAISRAEGMQSPASMKARPHPSLSTPPRDVSVKDASAAANGDRAGEVRDESSNIPDKSKPGKTKDKKPSGEPDAANDGKNLPGVGAAQDVQPNGVRPPASLTAGSDGAAGKAQEDEKIGDAIPRVNGDAIPCVNGDATPIVVVDEKPVTAGNVLPDAIKVDEGNEGQKPLQGADTQKPAATDQTAATDKTAATDRTARTAKAANGAMKNDFLSALNAAADEKTNPAAALNDKLTALAGKTALADAAPKDDKAAAVDTRTAAATDDKTAALVDDKAVDEKIFAQLKEVLGKNQAEGGKDESIGLPGDKVFAVLKGGAMAEKTPVEAGKDAEGRGQSDGQKTTADGKRDDVPGAAKASTDAQPMPPKFDTAAADRTEIKQLHEPVKTLSIDDKTLTLTRRSDTSIEVRVEPKGFGRIDIDLNVDKGTVNAHISASDSNTRALLENNIKSIIDALSKDGLNVAGFSVSLKDRGDGGANDAGGRSAREGRGDGKNGGRKEAGVQAIERPSSVYSTDGKLSIFV